MSEKRIVERLNREWVVRSKRQGPVLSRHGTQQGAVQAAIDELRSTGGQIRVHGGDGSFKKLIQVEALQSRSDDAAHARPMDRAAKWGLGIAAIGIPLAIVLALYGPQWSKALTEEPVVNQVAKLHAGENLNAIDDAIGAATVTKNVEGDAKWKRSVYLRDDFAVSAISGEDNRIVVLTLLVCGSDFDATIKTPSGNQLRLGDRPLASAEEPSEPPGANDRFLYYTLGVTGSWLSRFLEPAASEPASGSNWLSYAVGYSSACASVPDDLMTSLFADGGFTGEAPTAPPEIRDFRQSTPPNFYTEIDLSNWNLQIDDLGMGTFESTSSTPKVVQRDVPLTFLGGGEDIPHDWPRE